MTRAENSRSNYGTQPDGSHIEEAYRTFKLDYNNLFYSHKCLEYVERQTSVKRGPIIGFVAHLVLSQLQVRRGLSEPLSTIVLNFRRALAFPCLVVDGKSGMWFCPRGIIEYGGDLDPGVPNAIQTAQ